MLFRSGLILRQIGLTPSLHEVQNGEKAFAQRGEGVLHMRRHLLKILPVQKAVRFQFPQLLGQRGFGDLAQMAAQTAEPAHILHTDII